VARPTEQHSPSQCRPVTEMSRGDEGNVHLTAVRLGLLQQA
jgi:hypothetical protein